MNRQAFTPAENMKRDAILISEMARVLRCKSVDLGDERAVVVALTSSRYGQGDVYACMDAAIEEARKQGPKLAEILGDGIAGALAIGVWVVGYCIVCPPGSF